MERSRKPRRLAVVALALAIAVAAAVGLASMGDGVEEMVFPRRPGPAAYRLLYRVDTFGEDPTTTWEERIVERPFLGRIITSSSQRPPSDTSDGSGTLNDLVSVYLVDGESVQELGGRVPGPGSGDDALTAVLDDAVAAGVARPLGTTRTVLGRQCTVYRVGEPLDRRLAVPTAENHDDLCVDDDGLILEERWTFDGELLMVRTAIAVDTSPPRALVDRALSTKDARELPEDVFVSKAAVSERARTFIEEPPLPEGFSHVATVEFVRASARGIAGGIDYQSASWAFARGSDFVVVEAGTGRAPWGEQTPLRTLEVRDLGSIKIILNSHGAEALAHVAEGRWIRVSASAPAAWVERYVSGIRLVDDRAEG